MKLSLNTAAKVFLVSTFLVLSVIGFMIKLPSVFRHVDKELHSLFYFIAAAVLNLLFAKKKFYVHLLIFVGLYLFGVAIEHAQAYSNKLFHVKIHGRYDPEDVLATLKGLIAFSITWMIYVSFSFVYAKVKLKEVLNRGE
jgi:hypothetical protein